MFKGAGVIVGGSVFVGAGVIVGVIVGVGVFVGTNVGVNVWVGFGVGVGVGKHCATASSSSQGPSKAAWRTTPARNVKNNTTGKRGKLLPLFVFATFCSNFSILFLTFVEMY